MLTVRSRAWLRFASLVALAFMMKGTASADMLIFQEGASPTTGYESGGSYIDNNSPDGVFDNSSIFVGAITPGSRITRGLLGFDLSAIPIGSTINSVTLDMTSKSSDGSSVSESHTLSIHELTTPFIETESTWTNATTATAWTTAGGDFNATVLSSLSADPTTIGTDQPLAFASSASFVTATQNAHDGSGVLSLLIDSDSNLDLDRGLFRLWSDDSTDPSFNPRLTVDFTPNSNIVVNINRDTGNITLENPFAGSLNLLGYSLTSANGALNPAAWQSIAENSDMDNGGSVDPNDNWTELSDPNEFNDLSEIESDGGDGATIVGSQTINLGDESFLPSIFADDVQAEILLDTGEVRVVSVNYSGGLGTVESGDISGGGTSGALPDGAVDILDWQAFQAAFGSDVPQSSLAAGYLAGDFDGDLDHTLADFNLFEQYYDAANTPGAFASMLASVPEPSSALLLVIAGMGVLFMTNRQRRFPLSLARVGGTLILLISSGVMVQSADAQTVWGVTGENGSDGTVDAIPPTAVFSFDATNAAGTIVSHGNAQLNGTEVYLDAMAVKSNGLGVAFVLTPPSVENDPTTATSQMVLINGGTINGDAGTPVDVRAAGAIQTYLAGGAAYDNLDRLWIVDDVTGNLHQINDTDGSIVSTVALSNAAGNTVDYTPLERNRFDIAFDSTGTGYMSQLATGGGDTLWTLNTTTGVLDEVSADVSPSSGDGRIWAGLAVNPTDEDKLYGITYTGVDGIYEYSITAGGTASLVVEVQPATGINGGRGDLANGPDSLLVTEMLTLQVNTTSGQARLVGAGQLFDIDVDGYRITSDSNSLNTTDWDSLEDNPSYGDGTSGNGIGWESLVSESDEIAEANLLGSSVFALNDSVSLGEMFVTGGGPSSEDLVMELSLEDGRLLSGLVVYVAMGDMNNDGNVDELDVNPFVQALTDRAGYDSNNYGTDADFAGDFNGNGTLDLGDISGFKAAVPGFGASSESSVPEPTTGLLVLIASLGLLISPRRMI